MRTFPYAGTATPLTELLSMSIYLVCNQAQRQARLQFSLLDVLQRPGALAIDRVVHALRDCIASVLALPFDAARVQHAAGVQAGAVPRSLLESQHFEQQLGLMERLTLGPLARDD